MQNFELYNPTNLVFGKGQIEKLGTLVPKNAKILLAYGGGTKHLSPECKTFRSRNAFANHVYRQQHPGHRLPLDRADKQRHHVA